MEECTRLEAEKATFEWGVAMLLSQLEQAGARERMLVEGWAYWERRARTLEELGRRSGAWEWIAQMVARGKFQRTSPPLLDRPKPEIVEVTLDPYPPPPPRLKFWDMPPRFLSPPIKSSASESPTDGDMEVNVK